MKNLKAALAISLSIGFVSAQAGVSQSFSSASLSNFSYQLFDLNPNDNVASAITFSLYSTGNVTLLSDASAQDSKYAIGTLLTGNAIQSTTRSLSTANTSATGLTVAGSGLYSLINSSASVEGTANGGSALIDGVNQYSSKSFITSYLSSFKIAKNTAVVFSADATSNAQVSSLPAGVDNSGNYSSASAYLEVTGGGQSAFSGKASFADYVNNISTDSGRIAVAFFNFGSSDLQGSLNARAEVEGSIAVTAVPEPETYAMLLSGLGLICVAMGRRRTKQP